MHGDSFAHDGVIHGLAAGQLGLVAVRQAASLGVGRSALERRRRAGLLATVFPGVLRVVSHPVTDLQRSLAAALAVPGSVLAGPSAGLVDGLPVGGVDTPVLLVPSARAVRIGGVAVARSSARFPVRAWMSVRVTSPAATVVMLPRYLSRNAVERCLDHCLAHRLTTVRHVAGLLAVLPPRSVPGRRLLLELLAARGDGPAHRSRLEQTVARWLDAAGLHGWSPNLWISLSCGGMVEVDFAWPTHRAILEVSPFFTHGSRVTQERDAERRRLLVADGWRVVEATDAHLASPAAFAPCVAAVRRILDRAA